MINSPLSSWSCILPFHCELINQTISLNIIQFYTCNSTLINTNTSYLTRRYECYRNDWYLHRYRDAWCIHIVILLWRLPLLCSESAMCYWHYYSTMHIWWYKFYCWCKHSMLANHLLLPSFSLLHIWRKCEGITTALHYCPLFLNSSEVTYSPTAYRQGSGQFLLLYCPGRACTIWQLINAPYKSYICLTYSPTYNTESCRVYQIPLSSVPLLRCRRSVCYTAQRTPNGNRHCRSIETRLNRSIRYRLGWNVYSAVVYHQASANKITTNLLLPYKKAKK